MSLVLAFQTISLTILLIILTACLSEKNNSAHYKTPYTCVSTCIRALYQGNMDKATSALVTSEQNTAFIKQWTQHYQSLSTTQKKQFIGASFIFDNKATQVLQKDSLYQIGISIHYKKKVRKDFLSFYVLNTNEGYKIEQIRASKESL